MSLILLEEKKLWYYGDAGKLNMWVVMKSKLAITVMLGIWFFLSSNAIWASGMHQQPHKSHWQKIYVPTQNIFSNGTKIVVKLHNKFFEVPYVHNAKDGKGFFISKSYVSKVKMQQKGQIWECWCGETFRSRRELQQHYWEEGHGHGMPSH